MNIIQIPSTRPERSAFARIISAVGLLAASCLFGCVSHNPHRTLADEWLRLRSPDGSIEVVVTAKGLLTYSVFLDDQPVVRASRLGLKLVDGPDLGSDVEVVKETRQSVNSVWENRLGKRRFVPDRHNELRLTLRENTSYGHTFDVVFRAFDDGVAIRYEIPKQLGLDAFTVEQERTEFVFPRDFNCFAGQYDNGGFKGSQEWEFKPQRLSNFNTQSVVGLPLLVQESGLWVAITEADLLDWAGMWLGGAPVPATNGVSLAVKLAPRREGGGLVRGFTPHQSPWRVLMIGRQPGRLIESDLVVNLASPCQLADTSWIKPGKMAWDHWWSGDVQMNTATLKQYIQLAADMGWPYQLVDWQWYGDYNKPTSNITNVNPAVDMNEVRRFAEEKGVRLWLWLYWTDAERDDAYQKAFAVYEKWGIAGVKIDFMDSDDQFMVNWYGKMTRAAADHHLMINFHGAYKPTGLIRTLPNQVTREGVLGNEYNRWSARVTPEHKLTLPFTRFLAGPGDFTPGGFLNRQPDQFKADPKAAEVQGTRASELALFVVYDSPVCCVCDSPDHYTNQLGVDFLKIVPTVWDDTRVLDGVVAEHLVMARRSGDEWYLGALNDRKARELPVKLDFLGTGAWTMRLWKDAADASTNATNVEIQDRVVNAGDTLSLQLAPAGGSVAHFIRR